MKHREAISVQGRKPGMVDGPGGLDQLFCPGYRFRIVEQNAEERRVDGDGGGGVEVVVVGGPAERGAQIGQFDGEPGIGLALVGGCPTRP